MEGAPIEQGMRLFVALSLDPGVRAAIGDALARYRIPVGRAVRWVDPSLLHLTLKFLGERSPAFLEALAEALAPIAAGHAPVRLELGRLGAFPSLSRPRVLWLAVAENPALAVLYQEIEAAAAALGAPPEARRFAPHLTVGRVRPDVSPPRASLDDAARGLATFHAISVASTLDLMSSELTPAGPRYRAERTFAFTASSSSEVR